MSLPSSRFEEHGSLTRFFREFMFLVSASNHLSNLNVCGRRIDLQFRIIGWLFLPFASKFSESNEYQTS
jgi:hypothetical protein